EEVEVTSGPDVVALVAMVGGLRRGGSEHEQRGREHGHDQRYLEQGAAGPSARDRFHSGGLLALSRGDPAHHTTPRTLRGLQKPWNGQNHPLGMAGGQSAADRAVAGYVRQEAGRSRPALARPWQNPVPLEHPAP